MAVAAEAAVAAAVSLAVPVSLVVPVSPDFPVASAAVAAVAPAVCLQESPVYLPVAYWQAVSRFPPVAFRPLAVWLEAA